jgi:hypothetical protein
MPPLGWRRGRPRAAEVLRRPSAALARRPGAAARWDDGASGRGPDDENVEKEDGAGAPLAARAGGGGALAAEAGPTLWDGMASPALRAELETLTAGLQEEDRAGRARTVTPPAEARGRRGAPDDGAAPERRDLAPQLEGLDRRLRSEAPRHAGVRTAAGSGPAEEPRAGGRRPALDPSKSSVADYLRERLRVAREKHSLEVRGRRWLCSVLAERAVDATAEMLAREDAERARKERKRSRRRGKDRRKRRRGSADDEGSRGSGSETASSSSLEGQALKHDTEVRRTAARRPGALLESMLVAMLRQVGDHHGPGETAAAAGARSLANSYLTRVLVPQTSGGTRLPLRSERELRTLAGALDCLMAGRLQELGDLLAQRFRAVEAAALEEGGWSVARHLEVIPETRPSTTTTGLRAAVVATEREEQKVKEGLRRTGGGDLSQRVWRPPFPPLPGGRTAEGHDLPSALSTDGGRKEPGEKGSHKGRKGKEGKGKSKGSK